MLPVIIMMATYWTVEFFQAPSSILRRVSRQLRWLSMRNAFLWERRQDWMSHLVAFGILFAFLWAFLSIVLVLVALGLVAVAAFLGYMTIFFGNFSMPALSIGVAMLIGGSLAWIHATQLDERRHRYLEEIREQFIGILSSVRRQHADEIARSESSAPGHGSS